MAKQGSFPFFLEAGTWSQGTGQVPMRWGKTSPGLSPEQCLERALSELVRFYRHAGAGRLVAGIVHRMNTPLQVISFQLELLEQKEREAPEMLAACPEPAAAALEAQRAYRREKLLQFRHETEKLQDLARRLILQGVHEEARDRQQLDLNRLVEEQLELYQAHPLFKHRVRKNLRLAGGLPPLYGHYLDFAQSFRNLLDNALEAMEESEPRELTLATALEGGSRVLSLRDTGGGVPAASRPLIFRPFFTTKPGHAGLGLFLARRLLAPYGGGIRLESVPRGTLARVLLPLL